MAISLVWGSFTFTIMSAAAKSAAAAVMIVNVKEPQASEIAMLEPRHLLFTYLHLAPALLLLQIVRADVTIYDISNARLAELDMFFGSQIKTAYASKAAIAAAVRQAHLVIGAVLVPGAAAPKLVTRDMLKTMKRGSVLVDIAIDQGGCFETSRATTHSDPVFEIDGVIHYCVANMPGAVARTSASAPRVASFSAQGRVALLSATAEVRAPAPGMFATQ